jgi:hypothetical protein
MKKLIFFFLLIISCTKPEYCWQCNAETLIEVKNTTTAHYAISEYCDRTEEWAEQREQEGTWISTLISTGDTVKYITTTRCSKK